MSVVVCFRGGGFENRYLPCTALDREFTREKAPIRQKFMDGTKNNYLGTKMLTLVFKLNSFVCIIQVGIRGQPDLFCLKKSRIETHLLWLSATTTAFIKATV